MRNYAKLKNMSGTDSSNNAASTGPGGSPPPPHDPGLERTRPSHIINAVFDNEDEIGFMYTVGLHDLGKAELYASNVPRALVEPLARAMNFIATRNVLAGQSISSNGLIIRARSIDLADGMTQCNPNARCLQLCPLRR